MRISNKIIINYYVVPEVSTMLLKSPEFKGWLETESANIVRKTIETIYFILIVSFWKESANSLML